MLVKFNDVCTINAKEIVSMICGTNVIPPKYKGWWFWRKEAAPQKTVYTVKVTYICAIHGTQGSLSWSHDDRNNQVLQAKAFNDIIMSFDENYVNKAFENEVLK